MIGFIKKNCLLLLLLINSFFANGTIEIDSLLNVLDNTVENRSVYDQKKELKLDGLKLLLGDKGNSSKQNYQLQNKLILEYESYQFDSVLYYVDRNIDIGESLNNHLMVDQTKLHLARLLASSGRYKESSDVLSEIDKENLSGKLLVEYYKGMELVYNELRYQCVVDNYSNNYSHLQEVYKDSLLSLVDSDSEISKSFLEIELRKKGEFEKCRKVNDDRLGNYQIGERSYSIITYQRSNCYEHEGNSYLQKKFLILSSISDIQASVKDNASLTKLALLLFKEGDIVRAHRYINFSFEDADFYNSKLRLVVLSNILPVINSAYNMEIQKQKSRLRIYLTIISILFVCLCGALLYITKQIKSIREARNQLQSINRRLETLNSDLKKINNQQIVLNGELKESNHIKEQYIGNFFAICSNYINKLDAYQRSVNRLIKAKKYSELMSMTRSSKLMDSEINQFYENFDHTFLNIYPDFVDHVNSLLKEQEIIVLKKGEVMNTQLRIFALIRLGITDSSKIAELLRYSVNTIYNYRVKIKNKAIVPRNEFEDHIKKIGAYKQ